jgi:hypothetical protein
MKENGESRNYVLDSTAFLALLEDEPGAEIEESPKLLTLPYKTST